MKYTAVGMTRTTVLLIVSVVCITRVWSHSGPHDTLTSPASPVIAATVLTADTAPAYAVRVRDLPDAVAALVHSHSSVLDQDGVMVASWTPGKEEVVWTIEASTLGWIGFGISSNGGMDGADIVTAWVVDGVLHVQDRHGVGHSTPPVDAVGNWRPLSAKENSTHTTVTLARGINTCDQQDFPLSNETTRLIYAWGPEDPTGDSPPYHGVRRGARFALTLLPPTAPGPTAASLGSWRVSQRRGVPAAKETFYWCHVGRLPQFTTKHHYVGFKMNYGENARTHLHHVVAFECQSQRAGQSTAHVYDKFVGLDGFECYTPSMPEEFNWCEKFFINWAVGSEGEYLPDTVGVPMGEKFDGPTYLLFQTHYNNPTLLPNLWVSWSMDLYYTNKVRQFEAGNMALGHALNLGLMVPPHAKKWLVSGHCSEECTRQELPDEGVSIFMVFLHAHYLGRAIRLRHFRAGQELPPVAQDAHFDSKYQQARLLQREVLFLPGDHLTVECDFSSPDRPAATFSGWRAQDEMCQAFISFYPRVKMALCRSSPTLDTLGGALGISTIPRNINLDNFIFDTELEDGRTYQDAVNSMAWAELGMNVINRKISHGEHLIKCQYNSRVKIQVGSNTTKYPDATPYMSEADRRCGDISDHDFYSAPEPHHHHHHDHHHDDDNSDSENELHENHHSSTEKHEHHENHHASTAKHEHHEKHGSSSPKMIQELWLLMACISAVIFRKNIDMQ